MKKFTLMALALTTFFCGEILAFQSSPESIIQLQINDFGRGQTAVKQSAWQAYWTSKSMAKIREPVEAWRDKEMKAALLQAGLPEDTKMADLLSGEVLFQLHEFSLAVPEGKDKPMLNEVVVSLFLESKMDKWIDFLFAKAIKDHEAKKGSVRSDATAGASIKILSGGDMSLDKNGQPVSLKPMELWLGKKDNSYFVVAGPADAVKQTVIYTLAKSSRASKDLGQVSLRLNKFNSNVQELLSIAAKKMQQQAMEGKLQGPMAMAAGLDLPHMINALGILDLKKVELSVNYDKTAKSLMVNSEVDFLQAPRGLVKLFMPDNLASVLPVPAWVPGDVIRYSAQRLPLSQWFNIITGYIGTELPMMAPMVMGQIQMFGQQQGVDLNADLFSQSADTLHVIQLKVPAGEKPDLGAVYVLELKNGLQFKKGLHALLSSIPMMGITEKKDSDAEWLLMTSMMDPTQVKFSMAFSKDKLVMGVTKEMVEGVLHRAQGGKGMDLTKNPEYAKFASFLPAKVQMLQYLDTDGAVESIILFLQSHAEEFQPKLKDLPFQIQLSDLATPQKAGVKLGSGMSWSVRESMGMKGWLKSDF